MGSTQKSQPAIVSRVSFNNPSPKTIVQHIWDAREAKTPDAEIAGQLARMGLASGEIAHAFEMIEFSMNRAFMENSGGILTADYDEDPIFQASLSFARRRLPASPGVRRERLIKRSAIAVAVCAGLFAVGVVIYVAVDFLKASH